MPSEENRFLPHADKNNREKTLSYEVHSCGIGHARSLKWINTNLDNRKSRKEVSHRSSISNSKLSETLFSVQTLQHFDRTSCFLKESISCSSSERTSEMQLRTKWWECTISTSPRKRSWAEKFGGSGSFCDGKQEHSTSITPPLPPLALWTKTGHTIMQPSWKNKIFLLNTAASC